MKYIDIIFYIFLGMLFTENFDKVNYAYLDPGTGSYLFQLIIAALIGGLFTIKLFWQKIISFFKKMFFWGKGEQKKDERY